MLHSNGNHQDLNDESCEASQVLPMKPDQDHTEDLSQKHPEK